MGEFFVLDHREDYSIFYDEKELYAVKSLIDDITDLLTFNIFGISYVETILYPIKIKSSLMTIKLGQTSDPSLSLLS